MSYYQTMASFARWEFDEKIARRIGSRRNKCWSQDQVEWMERLP